eukprot:jgi/Astpho2/1600/Aster-x0072
MSRLIEPRVVWHARAAVHKSVGLSTSGSAQAGTLKANAEELRQKISEAHATLDEKRHTVSVLDEKYQAVELELQQGDAQLANKEAAVYGVEQQLAAREADIAKQDALIASLKKTVSCVLTL